MIEASLALHSCVSLSTCSNMLLMALILACSKSFSAFLIIFLAFGVSKVDFSLNLPMLPTLVNLTYPTYGIGYYLILKV